MIFQALMTSFIILQVNTETQKHTHIYTNIHSHNLKFNSHSLIFVLPPSGACESASSDVADIRMSPVQGDVAGRPRVGGTQAVKDASQLQAAKGTRSAAGSKEVENGRDRDRHGGTRGKERPGVKKKMKGKN